jgi:PIN domain nuclease of toxin-antitoxin system
VGRPLLILLDTHVVLWLGLEQERISRNALAAIDEARQRNSALAISDVTLMEIAQLYSRRRIGFPAGLEPFMEQIERRFRVFPITRNIVMQAYELPASYPNDPVDRVIGATALVEDLPLITADKEIRRSRAVPTIW